MPDAERSAGCVIIAYLAGDILAFILALKDTGHLRRTSDRGYLSIAVPCLVLSGRTYLLARAIKRRTGARLGVFAAWVAAFLVAVTAVMPAANDAKTSNATFNQAGVQAQIAKTIRRRTAYSVTVALCLPDPPRIRLVFRLRHDRPGQRHGTYQSHCPGRQRGLRVPGCN